MAQELYELYYTGNYDSFCQLLEKLSDDETRELWYKCVIIKNGKHERLLPMLYNDTKFINYLIEHDENDNVQILIIMMIINRIDHWRDHFLCSYIFAKKTFSQKVIKYLCYNICNLLDECRLNKFMLSKILEHFEISCTEKDYHMIIYCVLENWFTDRELYREDKIYARELFDFLYDAYVNKKNEYDYIIHRDDGDNIILLISHVQEDTIDDCCRKMMMMSDVINRLHFIPMYRMKECTRIYYHYPIVNDINVFKSINTLVKNSLCVDTNELLFYEDIPIINIIYRYIKYIKIKLVLKLCEKMFTYFDTITDINTKTKYEKELIKYIRLILKKLGK